MVAEVLDALGFGDIVQQGARDDQIPRWLCLFPGLHPREQGAGHLGDHDGVIPDIIKHCKLGHQRQTSVYGGDWGVHQAESSSLPLSSWTASTAHFAWS